MRTIIATLLMLAGSTLLAQTVYTVRKKITAGDIEIVSNSKSYSYYAFFPGTSIANLTGDVQEVVNGGSLNVNCDCELYEDGALVESNNQTATPFITFEYSEKTGTNFSNGGYVNTVGLNTWDGAIMSTVSIDLNPGTCPYLTGPAGTTTSAALTYSSFPNIAPFATALNIALKNGLAANGYSYSNVEIAAVTPWVITIKSRIIDNPTTNVTGFTRVTPRVTINYFYNGSSSSSALQGSVPISVVSGKNVCRSNYVNPLQYIGPGSGYGSIFGCCYLNSGDYDFGNAWYMSVEFNSTFYNYVYSDPVPLGADPLNVGVSTLSVAFNTTCTSPSYNWEAFDGFWGTYSTNPTLLVEEGDGGQYRAVVTCVEGTYTSDPVTP